MAKSSNVRRRGDQFVTRTETRIWQEIPLEENPFLAEQCRCHGYDILELAGKRSLVDVLLLLFTGELPAPPQKRLMEFLMIALINPGPRHPACRASMNAAVSRANTSHLLPIGLSVFGGKHLGGEEVVTAMRFLQSNRESDPHLLADDLLCEFSPPDEGDWRLAPGFGCRFGSIDPLPNKLAAILQELPGSGDYLHWGSFFAKRLETFGGGWLAPGVAAAVFLDLGMPPRSGAGLFQLICAPGILAHGLEMADKPITAMPFLDEEHYVISEKARNKKM